MLAIQRRRRMTLLVVWLGLGGLALAVVPEWTLGQSPATQPVAADTTGRIADPFSNSGDTAVAAETGASVLQPAAPAANATAAPPNVTYAIRVDDGASRDQQLRSIEARIQALLEELRSIQSDPTATIGRQGVRLEPAAPQQEPGSIGLPGPSHLPQSAPPTRYRLYADAPQPQRVELRGLTVPYVARAPRLNAIIAEPGVVEQTALLRAKYSLPSANAEALATFIGQHLPDVDAKAAGDSLTVTATPDAQGAIGQFVSLLRRAAAPDPGAVGVDPGGASSGVVGSGPGVAAPIPTDSVPDAATSDAAPSDAVPSDAVPSDAVPSDAVPSDAASGDTRPLPK